MPFTPAQVMLEMRDNPRRGMDPVIVKAFINLTGIYPPGTLVVLDTFELGIVHAVNHGCCGWDEFARAALAACGITADVQAVSSDAFPGAARRPPNGCLESELVGPLRPWRDGLREWASSRQAAKGG